MGELSIEGEGRLDLPPIHHPVRCTPRRRRTPTLPSQRRISVLDVLSCFPARSHLSKSCLAQNSLPTVVKILASNDSRAYDEIENVQKASSMLQLDVVL